MSRRRDPNLKKSNTQVEYTLDQLEELEKCANDPLYFIKNYIQIKHPTKGRIPFNLYDYQEGLVNDFHEHRFNIVLSARQTGKTETSGAYLLWYSIFKEEKTVLIVSKNSKHAMEIIGRIKGMYENLPTWLKPGIDEDNWNKHTCAFDNKSVIEAETTTEDSGRGSAISLLYCLEEKSTVTVRNKETGEIEELTLRELYDKM